MVDIKLKYVTSRSNKSGSVRWYWQRKGFPLIRLPDDDADRASMAIRLNKQGDDKEGALAIPGSIGWVIETYKNTDEFKDLAEGTKKYYRRWLKDIGSLGLKIPFKLLTRKRVVDFISAIPGKGERKKAAAVLRNLFSLAEYHELVKANHASRLRLKSPPRREHVWDGDTIPRWLAAAADHPHGAAMVSAFTVLRYCVQRPNDTLRLDWHRHDLGDRIRLRQQKTGKTVDVAMHRDLRAHLDSIRPAKAEGPIIRNRGRRIPYSSFSRWFHEIAEAAGLGHLQPRDLRRTAMVNMAEAGATPIEIAGLSGHSIDETVKILETYVPRTFAMGQNAIKKLERHEAKSRKKSNAVSKKANSPQ